MEHEEASLKFISPLSLCTKRIQEIERLDRALHDSRLSACKQLFQTLPKHLRRRAASHNPNRLPRKYRRYTGKAGITPPKKSVRRKRRRNLSLLHKKRTSMIPTPEVEGPSGACGDSGPSKWIETHYWHAKRMHTRNMWGHRIAFENSQKIKRPLYRIARGSTPKPSVILHDKSYEEACHIQCASWEALLLLMDKITDPLERACPHSILSETRNLSADVTSSTTFFRHGTFWLYHSYPCDLLSSVDFVLCNSESIYSLIIWIPPYSFPRAYSSLQCTCSTFSGVISVSRISMNKFELEGSGAFPLIAKVFSPIHPTEQGILHHVSHVEKPERMLSSRDYIHATVNHANPFITNSTPSPVDSIRTIRQSIITFIQSTRPHLIASLLLEIDYSRKQTANPASKEDPFPMVILVKSVKPTLIIHLLIPKGLGSVSWTKLTRSGMRVMPCSYMDLAMTRLSMACMPHACPDTKSLMLTSLLGLWRSNTFPIMSRADGGMPMQSPILFTDHWIVSPYLWTEACKRQSLTGIVAEDVRIDAGLVLGRVQMTLRGRPSTWTPIFDESFKQIGIILGHGIIKSTKRDNLVPAQGKWKDKKMSLLRDGFSFGLGQGGNIAAIRLDFLLEHQQADPLSHERSPFCLNVMIGATRQAAVFTIK